MNISGLFDQCAQGYDQDRRRLVPFFDDFYGTALAMIPSQTEEGIDVLDLGTGTGLFAAMVARILPSSRLHLTDISAAMLAQARLRFADSKQVTFAQQDHLQLAATADFDLVVSALSIHHLEQVDKKALFAKIFRAVRPGGMFINADQALGATPQKEEAFEQRWLAEVRANHVPPASLESARERMREDRNALLADQLARHPAS